MNSLEKQIISTRKTAKSLSNLLILFSVIAALTCSGGKGNSNSDTGSNNGNGTSGGTSVTETSWYTFLGGSGLDQIASIINTSDGGYLVTGYAAANIATLSGQTPLNPYSSANDIIVVKLSSTGSVTWYTFLGGTGNDNGNSVAQTSDGGYTIAGFTTANIANLGGQTPLNAYSTSTDMIVVKLTSAGAVAWYTFLGGTGGDFASSIAKTSDGGCIVAGTANANIANLGGQTPLNAYTASNDAMIVKLTSAGAVSWYTFLGNTGGESPASVTQTSDGGYALVGTANANIANLAGQTPLNAYSAGVDILAIKLTSGGAVSWYTFLGGTGADTPKSIAQTSDGGYIIGGFSNANIANIGGQTPVLAYSASNDMLGIKLTSAGAVSWYTFLGGSGNDGAYAIIQASDGGYLVAGYSDSNLSTLGGQTPLNAYSAANDMLVVKLSSAGAVSWYTFLGGGNQELAVSVAQTSDGGFILAGEGYGNIATFGGQSPGNGYSAGQDILILKLKTTGAF